ncbi:MAG TPA: amidohydrolase family protein [Gemmatimonadales bacterium]|nr:amidohydrolase family protein [Gemmatimonadales bacterium]
MTPAPRPLVDVHAHFLHERCGRSDWADRNLSRLAAGARIGITVHVASILGSWGHTSPVYFPSPADVTAGNEAMRALARAHPGLVRGYVTVNPNYTDHALGEIERGLAAGMVGVKLAASRRASDALLDPVAALAAAHGAPLLQHIWQRRTREVPNQEISDALDLAALAARHPDGRFLLAHIGGGGDWAHSLRALQDVPNVWVDLSGSGVDRGMLELCLECVGAERLVWGTDLTMDTGWAKLRALEAMGLADAALEDIRWKTAARLFRLSL